MTAVVLASDERAAELVVLERPAPDDRRLRQAVSESFDNVWRLLASLGVTDDDLDDASQQVFLIFADRFADITRGSERSFLIGTSLRIAAEVRRRRSSKREVSDDAAPATIDPAPGPDELADRRKAGAMLEAILDTMGAELREVFVLFEIEGMSTPEIASLVGIPLGTAASRLRRAREDFREKCKAATHPLKGGAR
jgi:RNA polymerase sigma-70 factor (ECF subfamily)